MKKEMICIICPRGCTLQAQGDEEIMVTGNACPKGEKYAIDEIKHPMRTVTSTVRVKNRPNVMVSVKTLKVVPKEKIGVVMEQIRAAEVEAPIKIGDVILKDICKTDIVATKNIY